MKKVLFILALLMGLAGIVQADQDYQEITVVCTTGGVYYSDAFTIAGELDKIEYVKTGPGTNTAVLATWTGTTAVDTYFTKALAGTASGVSRPRVIGTTTAAANIAGAITEGTNSATTVLVAPYEKMRFGGGAKIRVTGDSDALTSTNVFKVYLTR